MAKPNPCLRPYHERAFTTLSEYMPIQGKQILEIGGIPPDWVVANELLRRGASAVFAINNRSDIQTQKISERFHVIHMDANQLELEGECFDMVVGTAVLEHFINLKGVLAQASGVLKPGGLLYLHGGPIWSCKWGHHLWVHADDARYEFSGHNPIPDWHHLIFSKAEMRDHLLSRNIKENHANRIVDFVYEKRIINRCPIEEIEGSLRDPDWKVLSCKKFSWGDPDQRVMQLLLHAGYDSARDFSTGAMDVLLQKNR